MSFVQRLIRFCATSHTDLINNLHFQICWSSYSDIQCKVHIFCYMQNFSLRPRFFLEKTFSVPFDIHPGWGHYHSQSAGPLILIYEAGSPYSNTCRYLTFAWFFPKDEQYDCLEPTTEDIISGISLVKRGLSFLTWYPSIDKCRSRLYHI